MLVFFEPLAYMHAQLLSHVQLFVTLWTVAHQDSLSMEFSRQDYLSGLPFSLSGGLSKPGINPRLLFLMHCRWILHCLSRWGSPL